MQKNNSDYGTKPKKELKFRPSLLLEATLIKDNNDNKASRSEHSKSLLKATDLGLQDKDDDDGVEHMLGNIISEIPDEGIASNFCGESNA